MPDNNTETVEVTPALAASQNSWRCVQTHDKDGWLGLMADDVVIEDPIGEAITNPDGNGVRGKEAAAAFYDSNIASNNLGSHARRRSRPARPMRSLISWCC